MAEQHSVLEVTYKAAGDLSSYQYHFVYLSAANTVTVCGANGKAVGILQNDPDTAGKSARVMEIGISKLVMGETCSRGQFITSKSDGHGEVADAAGEFVRAIAREAAATGDGDIITVKLVEFETYDSDA